MAARTTAALAVVCAVFYLNNFCLAQKLDSVVCGTIGHQFFGRDLKGNYEKTSFRMCVEACRNNTNCNAVNYWSSNKTCRLIQTESRRSVVGFADCISSFIKRECTVTIQPSIPMKYTFVLPDQRAPFRLRFAVRVAKDCVIALAKGRNDHDVFCHITIGGWENTKSALRTGDLAQRTDITKSIESTDGILSATEFRAFWIEYENGVVRVGKDGERDAFLEWNGTAEEGSHSKVNIAISTWEFNGNSGEWVFDQNCK